jgi:hypothetical protein
LIELGNLKTDTAAEPRHPPVLFIAKFTGNGSEVSSMLNPKII